MRDLVKTYFGLFKIQVKYKINLKLEISMQPVCLLMIFSTLYTYIPHILIKDKLIDLIEITIHLPCISHFKMVMFLAPHLMESISLSSFVLLEHLVMLLTSTLAIN